MSVFKDFLNYRMDIRGIENKPNYTIKQCDTSSRVIRCMLTRNNSIPFRLDGWTPKLIVLCADGLTIYTLEGTIVDDDLSIIDFPLTHEITQHVGEIKFEVRLCGENNERLTFPTGSLTIEDSEYHEGCGVDA